MATLELSNSFSVSSVAGYKVGTSSTSSALGSGKDSYAMAHEKIATKTNDIFKNTIFGVNVVQAYPANGTAAVGASMTFTFDAVESIEGASADGKSITLTSADGEVRTYTIRDRTKGTATFTFSAGPDSVEALDTSTITLVDSDGTTVVFEIDDGTNGAGDGVSGSNIPIVNTDSGGVAVAGQMGPSNLATSLVYWINQQSSLDIVATNPSAGKVDLVGAYGTGSNTTITLSAASDWNGACSVNCPAAFTGGLGQVTIGKNEFNAGATSTLTATYFRNAVNDATHAHGIARYTTSTLLGAVTVTNVTTGTAGNTAIGSGGWDDICSVNAPSNFSGGVAATTPSITLQLSTDGTNWTPEGIAVADDAKLTSVGLHLFSVDLTDVVAPYARIVFNENNVDLGNVTSTGTHQAVYTTKL